MRYEIRELGVGGILDQAIAVTKDHFWLFAKIVLVLFLPFTLVQSWLAVSSTAAAQAGDFSAMKSGSMMIVGLLNGMVIFPITNAAIIYAVASSYLNRSITPGLAFRRSASVFLKLIGTMALLWLVLVGGMLLLVIPFFIFLLWYFLSIQVVVLEGLGGGAALKRSHQLMKGNYGTAIVLGLLVLVINWATAATQGIIPQPLIKVVLGTVIQSVLLVFGAAAWVVFYFSCRAKAEHFDLALLADAVGTDDDQPTGKLDISPGEAR